LLSCKAAKSEEKGHDSSLCFSKKKKKNKEKKATTAVAVAFFAALQRIKKK
jgi:hypothetical protein